MRKRRKMRTRKRKGGMVKEEKNFGKNRGEKGGLQSKTKHTKVRKVNQKQMRMDKEKH